MDLSTEEEGSPAADDMSNAEDKNDHDGTSRNQESNSSGKIPEKATDPVDKLTSLMTSLPLKKLEEALESCLFNKYIVEGQMDERKYSLKDQKRLVTQLVSEYHMLCGKNLEESKQCTTPTGDGCLSLEAVLDRVRVDSLHTQLPNALVELMFKDRQLVPRWKIDGVEERSTEPVAPPVVSTGTVTSRKESILLKLVSKNEEESKSPISFSATAGTDKGVPEINIGKQEEEEDDDDDVDDPAIMHIVRPKHLSAKKKKPVESLWEVVPSSTAKTGVGIQSAEKVVSGHSGQAPPLAWLTGASQWANPGLLSDSLSPPKKTAIDEGGISAVVSSLKVNSDVASTSGSSVPGSVLLASAGGVSSEVLSLHPVTENSSSSSSLHLMAVTGAQAEKRSSPTGLGCKDTSGNAGDYDALEQLKHLDGSREAEEGKYFPSFSDNHANTASEGYSYTYHNGEGLSMEDGVLFPSAIEDLLSRDKTPSESATTTAGASAVAETREHSQEVRGAEGNSDLNFLEGCFPDLSRDQLQKLLEVNGGDVELTTISALSAQPEIDDTIGHAPMEALDVDARAGSHMTLDDFPAISGHTTKNGGMSEERMEESANNSESDISLISQGSYKEQALNGDCGVDDEMPPLLAWTDSDMGGASGLVPGNQADINDALTWDVPEEDGTEVEEIGNEALQYGTGFLQEDNLVLKLSESLAIQLQSQFGSVDQTLFQEDCTGSDLIVLLSENAALQIYNKWVDTLKARAVENKVMAQLKEKGSPAAAAKFPGKKSAEHARNGPITSGAVKSSGGGLPISSSSVGAGVAYGRKTVSSSVPGQQKHGQTLEQEAVESASYEALRSDAAFHATKRSECFQKAAEARSRKRYEVASYYAQQGHHHTKKLKEANRKAALSTFEKNNLLRLDNQIDLHGLHVNEAIAALSERLNQLNDGEEYYVITGYGSGGSKKEARIKPVVKKYLARNNIWFEEKNPGLLRVVI